MWYIIRTNRTVFKIKLNILHAKRYCYCIFSIFEHLLLYIVVYNTISCTETISLIVKSAEKKTFAVYDISYWTIHAYFPLIVYDRYFHIFTFTIFFLRLLLKTKRNGYWLFIYNHISSSYVIIMLYKHNQSSLWILISQLINGIMQSKKKIIKPLYEYVII